MFVAVGVAGAVAEHFFEEGSVQAVLHRVTEPFFPWQELEVKIVVIVAFPTVRVTKLGEFSPIGPFFTLGSFSENYRNTQKIRLLFSSVLIADAECIGLHIVRFFRKFVRSPCLE
jgi:hypothetical protein